MEKKNVPQDITKLENFTREVCYALDENGNYVTELSTGWDIKTDALGVAWTDIEERVSNARKQVLEGKASPILFFMELRLMDVGIVSAYTGFWKWTIRRHMNAGTFAKLSEKKLKKYADAFDVSVNELKTMQVHED
ncbi:MAG TPA: hypothetical protein PKJ62_06030 [Bacteroidia bacterium]|nr:hypothetical protein [Bacteroidia bacterium]HNS11678.1 hypothetical protein [Bacteroidia bacterium]